MKRPTHSVFNLLSNYHSNLHLMLRPPLQPQLYNHRDNPEIWRFLDHNHRLLPPLQLYDPATNPVRTKPPNHFANPATPDSFRTAVSRMWLWPFTALENQLKSFRKPCTLLENYLYLNSAASQYLLPQIPNLHVRCDRCWYILDQEVHCNNGPTGHPLCKSSC
jgi:hypothetical protein